MNHCKAGLAKSFKFASTSNRAVFCRWHGMMVLMFAMLTCMMAPGTGLSQQTTGDILGTVTDVSGAALPNAIITIVNLGTRDTRTIQASANGDYVFNLLSPGDYSVSVTSDGFKTLSVSRITLLAGDRTRVNAPLVIGGKNETIEVTSVAPALQTDDSSVASTVSEKAVQQLPLNGRNFVTLTQTLPGANEGRVGGLNSGAQADDRRQSASISVNGQGSILNNLEIDGMDNNEKLIGTIGVRPSIEAIAELRVQSSNYSADSGRAGGGVINVITKSGTNQFHGSVYEFFRNDKLNAFPFQFGAHLTKPELRLNQFGGSLGGPVLKNKLFFFGDYEGFRIVNGTLPSSVAVPTQYEHDHPGDFTDNGGTNLNLTPALIDKVGAAYFSFYPAPNSGTNQFVGTAKNIQTSDAADGKFDYKVNDKNSIFFRAAFNKVLTTTSGIFPQVTVQSATFFPNINLAVSPSKAVNSQINYIHIFTPRLLFQSNVGYSFIQNGSSGNTNARVNDLLGQPNTSYYPGLARITVSQASFLGNGSFFVPLTDLDNTFQYNTSLNYTVGNHNIKVGGSIIRRQNTSAQSSYPDGLWAFTTLSNLYQGNYSSVQRVVSLVNPHLRSWEDNGYVQDDWHARPNLTLNLGLRYDVFTPFVEKNNKISNFNEFTGQVVVAGPSDRQVGVKNDFHDLSPRLGFSYSARPTLVVRGAYALVYFPVNTTSVATLKDAPFVSSFGPYTQTSAPAGFTKFGNGLPFVTADSAAAPVQLGDTVSVAYQSSQLHQFNFGVQKDFSGNTVTVQYVGNIGRHLSQIISNYNAASPNTASSPGSTVNAQMLRPYYSTLPTLTSVTLLRTEGVGYYDALQVVYERRLRHGLYINSNLTYSHNIDNALGVDGSLLPEGTGSLPRQVSSRDYGNSSLDLRTRVTTLINYELPFGHNLTGYRAILAKGWQTNALNIWSTTSPFTVVNATNIDGTQPGVGTSDRPNLIGNARISNPTNSQFFNTSAFVYDPLGTNPADGAQRYGQLGNERVNQVFGPHFRHLDVSLFKSVPVFHEANLQFRTEVFNILNMTNFGLPGATLNGANFGKITSTSANYTPRLIQFALKLQF